MEHFRLLFGGLLLQRSGDQSLSGPQPDLRRELGQPQRGPLDRSNELGHGTSWVTLAAFLGSPKELRVEYVKAQLRFH